jgi:hypothetical protein
MAHSLTMKMQKMAFIKTGFSSRSLIDVAGCNVSQN